MKGEGKFEELVVCSQEIAASTTQLVVASKVKAERGSEALQQLGVASKGVTEATGKVVASAKSGAQMIDEMGKYTAFVLLLLPVLLSCGQMNVYTTLRKPVHKPAFY